MLETIILAALMQISAASRLPATAQVVAFELAASELDAKVATPPSSIRLSLDEEDVREEAVRAIQRRYETSIVTRGDCRNEEPAACALLRVEVLTSKSDEFVVHSWAYVGSRGWWAEYRLRRDQSKWVAEKLASVGGTIGD
jgi:hypothetical protein